LQLWKQKHRKFGDLKTIVLIWGGRMNMHVFWLHTHAQVLGDMEEPASELTQKRLVDDMVTGGARGVESSKKAKNIAQ
jgi:hypothetical protein